jgi:hypothetical protein
MWGSIWVLGYGGTGLAPEYSNWLWTALMICGIAGGLMLRRDRVADCRGSGFKPWRMPVLFATIILFVFTTYTIMEPHHAKQVCAFPALITGMAYVALGLWMGIRYVIAGIAVVTLTMFGFFYIPTYWYFFWMALVGGGAMILSGIWFRTV